MTYCFDLDDTISVHTNRDYENASPIWAVVERMREIRQADPEAHILIHTARGMNSCKGDAKKAEVKNRPTIERWLWNNPQNGQNLFKMFEGIVSPCGKDENGNLIYKYNGRR